MRRQTDGDPENRADETVEAVEPNTTILPKREDASAITIVGIGGSAGSIPALELFLQNVTPPTETTAFASAYVVVLHLSPEHESHLAEILGRATRLPVQQVNDPIRIEAGNVYVIPPGKHLEMRDGMLYLSDPEPATGRRNAIDTFFRTLADTHGPQAAAVILSGTGADGTLGIRHIKEYGGLAVAQSPGDAEFDAMPRSAIATGLVDYVLPAAAMPGQIAAYWDTSRRMRIPQEAAPSPEQREEGPEQEAALQEVLTLVRAQTGHDFSLYKRGTVLRRIGRRMQVNRLETLPAYRDFIRTHPAEVGDLIADLLISVTQFFRDTAAWDALERDVVPRLFDGKGTSDEVRAWVCGCATGEEAYSLAILLLEWAEKMVRPPRIQIFATDMDGDAIARARAGTYPETISGDVSEERLRRWFYRQNGSYQIRKEVREAVLFAQHDVLRDTPFSRLDLITCRNLLIYLNREAQERVFRTFHFSLQLDGRLMLGSSESAEGADGLFITTDKLNRLYIRRSVVRHVVPPLPATSVLTSRTSPLGGITGPSITAITGLSGGEPTSIPTGPAIPMVPSVPALSVPVSSGAGGSRRPLFQNLIERFGPPTVLVNEFHDIVHISGDTSPFLRFNVGEPTFNLLQLIRPDLRVELRAALYAAATEGKEQTRFVQSQLVPGEEGGSLSTVRLTVHPAPGEATEGVANYFLVQLEEFTLPIVAAALTLPAEGVTERGDSARLYTSLDTARHLEEENAALQRQLHATVEQYEALTEEMKASNEELQATNEEMRSVAEELETGKEELQSVNEELSTVNHELKARVEEISITNSDLQNFLASTHIPTLFLDRELRIKRYTPAAEALFNLIPVDVGRPLTHLTNRLDYPALPEDAAAVLARLTPVEREVATADGQRHFLARLLPYRSEDDRIEGVVVTFVDITERKLAEETVRQREAELARVQRIGGVGGIDIDVAQGMRSQRSPEYLRLHGLTTDSIYETHEDWLRRVHSDDRDRAERTLQAALAGQGNRYESEYRIIRPSDGQERWLSAVAAIERDTQGQPLRLVGAHIDITARKRVEEALRESETRSRQLVEGVAQAFWETDAAGVMVTDSPTWRAYTGQTLEEWLGYGWVNAIHPEDREYAERQWRESIAMQRLVDAEFRLRSPDGGYRWTNIRATPLRNEDGTIQKWVGMNIDIDARKRAEIALRESEARLAVFFAQAAVGLSEISLEGRFLRVNDELCRILGRPREELLPLSIADVTYSDDMAPTQEGLDRAIAGEPTSLDKRYHRPDGTLIWANSTVTVLRDGLGEPQAFLVVTMDLTDRKRAEEATEAALAALAEANNDLEQRVAERTAELAEMSQMRQELLRQLVTAQEEERGRISRDLHDDTGQQISALLLGIRNLRDRPTIAGDTGVQQALDQLDMLATEVARKSHRLSFTLRPTELDDIGLMGALQNYVETWTTWSNIPAQVEGIGLAGTDSGGPRLPRETETTIYRVVQEALNNVLKYAVGQGATRVSIVVQQSAGGVLTIVEDDGPGFDVAAVLNQPPGQRRLGIFGMQERARLAGGTLNIESKPDEGTTIYLRLPITNDEER